MPARREEALLADLHLVASQVRQKWADKGYIYMYIYMYISIHILMQRRTVMCGAST